MTSNFKSFKASLLLFTSVINLAIPFYLLFLKIKPVIIVSHHNFGCYGKLEYAPPVKPKPLKVFSRSHMTVYSNLKAYQRQLWKRKSNSEQQSCDCMRVIKHMRELAKFSE